MENNQTDQLILMRLLLTVLLSKLLFSVELDLKLLTAYY
jgi:hypothetical protein